MANDLLHLTLGARRGMRRGTSALTWYERGCALEAADPVAAMVAYARAIAGEPGLADAHNNLGRLHHDAGDLVCAEAAYRRAIAADATIAVYWFNLGVALEDRGEPAGAIEAYDAAIARDALLADAHFNVARLLETAGSDGALRRAVGHLLRYRALVGSSARRHSPTLR